MTTPTANDVEFRAMALEMLAEDGRTLLLRQRTRQEVTSGADTGTVVSSPLSATGAALNGDHAQGASLLNLAGVSPGLLVAGDTVTIAGGDSYEVTGGPYHPDEDDEISGVGITPALAADFVDASVVTVSFTGTDSTIKGFPTKVATRWLEGVLTRAGDAAWIVSQQALDEAGITIEEGDEIYDGADTAAPLFTIVAMEPIASGELVAAVTLIGKRR